VYTPVSYSLSFSFVTDKKTKRVTNFDWWIKLESSKIMNTKLTVILVLCFTTLVFSLWSRSAHELIAEIAQTDLTEAASRKVRLYFNSQRMSAEAMWADNIKQVPEWRFSAGFHYANIPDGVCNYSGPRDCKMPTPGCVVSAITNYTQQMNHDNFQRAKDALRFVVHLVGDIHQPLHLGRASDLGGNRFSVTWFGRSTNLHSVWDGSIVGRRVDLDFAGDTTKFLTYLLKKLGTEPWKTAIRRWRTCRSGGAICPDEWAQESADSVCKVVYDGINNGTALAEPYYNRAIPVTEESIVKAAIRLANVINEIYK
jgi:hypothetical protein